MGESQIHHVVSPAGLVLFGKLPCAHVKIITVYASYVERIECGEDLLPFICCQPTGRYAQPDNRCDLGVQERGAKRFDTSGRPCPLLRLYVAVALIGQQQVKYEARFDADALLQGRRLRRACGHCSVSCGALAASSINSPSRSSRMVSRSSLM